MNFHLNNFGTDNIWNDLQEALEYKGYLVGNKIILCNNNESVNSLSEKGYTFREINDHFKQETENSKNIIEVPMGLF